MGFSLRDVNRALAATGYSGEMGTHSINILATWMLENSNVESDESIETVPPRQNLVQSQSLDCTESESISGFRRNVIRNSRRTGSSDIRNYMVERNSQLEQEHWENERHFARAVHSFLSARSLDIEPGLESGSVFEPSSDVEAHVSTSNVASSSLHDVS